MTFELILFYCFASLAIVSSFMVIGSKNPVFSVLFLVLVFFNVTGLLLLLGAEFLAIMFLIVYVGAIAVLFLFVIIILNVKFIELQKSLIQYIYLGGFVGFIFLIEIFLVLDSDLLFFINNLQIPKMLKWPSELYTITNIEVLGIILYTSYAYLFLLAGLILLIAIIGSIVLTIYQRGQVKRQNINLQINREFDLAVKLSNLNKLHF